MPVQTKLWKDTVLNNTGDVQGEYSGITRVVNGDDWQSTVRGAILSARTEIEERLMKELPSIFVNSNGQWDALSFDAWYGMVTESTMDNVLDYIANPEVLKSAATAWTIKTMWELRRADLNAEQNLNLEGETLIIKEWSDKFETRFTRALTRLKLDINRNGVVDNWERVRVRTLDISRA